MKKETQAIIASIIAHIIFGLSFPFTKVALSYCTPISLLSQRFVIAFVALNLLLLTGKVSLNFKGKNLKPLMCLAIFQPVLYFICETYGIQLTTATLSSIIIALIPIVTMIADVVFLKQKVTVFKVVCALISVVGVIMITLVNASEGAVHLSGVILLIGAVICAVGFAMASQKSSKEFSSFERTYFMMFFGGVFFTILSVSQNSTNLFQTYILPWTDGSFAISLLFLSLISSVIAFFSINFAYSNAPLTKVSLYANIVPIVSAIVGITVLGEPFKLMHGISASIILIGLIGFQLSKKST